MTDELSTKDKIVQLVRERTENFYQIHRLCCSESVFLVMTQGFSKEISPETAIRLGSGFCGGMGGAGCTCGSLGGAIMALGYFLGPGQPGGLKKKALAAKSKEMHDRFRDKFGSTCCRVLTQDVKHDRKLRRDNCQGLTGAGAEMVADLVLGLRPELIKKADLDFLTERDTRVAVLVRKIFSPGI